MGNEIMGGGGRGSPRNHRGYVSTNTVPLFSYPPASISAPPALQLFEAEDLQMAAVPPQCYHSGNLHVQRVLSCSLGAGHGTAGLLGGLVGAGKAGPRAAIDSEKEGPGDTCLPGRISVSTARFQEYEPAQPKKQHVCLWITISDRCLLHANSQCL